MFKVLSLLGIGVAGGAALSPETKGKIRDAAKSVKDDLGAATKDARAAATREWGRVRKFVREEIFEEPPRRPPAPPSDSAAC